MRRIAARVLVARSSLLAHAAPARRGGCRWTPDTLAHALDRLASTGRVLYVAAHPDDENTRLLAYLANAPARDAPPTCR